MKTPFNVKDINFDSIKFIPSGNGKSIMLRYLQNNKQNKFFVQTTDLKIYNIESYDLVTTLYFDLLAWVGNIIKSLFPTHECVETLLSFFCLLFVSHGFL